MNEHRIAGLEMLRSISALILLIPIACYGDVPESIIGKWQFDSVRTASEHMDQVFAANPEIATPEQIQKQKAGMAEHSAQADRQVTMTITEDTIRMVNTNSPEPTIMSYSVVAGNARLVVIESTTSDGNNIRGNIRLVEGGLAFETTDCRSDPDACEHQREAAKKSATSGPRIVGSSHSDQQPRQTRPGPTQPRWIYFRPFPATAETQ